MTRRFVTGTAWFSGWLAPAAAAALLCAGLIAPPRAAQAQPILFGSADDPREQLQLVWWRRESSLEPMLGLSLISNHWRAAGSAALNVVTQPVTARLRGTVRGGIYGDYRPDVDELYDLVRLVEFARYRPRRSANVYLRAGPIDRMRLGTGHVVNFFNSYAAWDERTVGVEAMRASPFVDVAAFTDNVLLDGVTGGRVALRPLAWTSGLRMRSLEVGLNVVTDLATRSGRSEELTGYNADVRLDALSSGSIRLSPFATVAWYPAHGSGIGFGGEVSSDNFIDLARFRLRVALYYNGREFMPGYVGAFYSVSNPSARILNAAEYLGGRRVVRYEGVALEDALGGNDLETELRLLIFERFEFWYYFRRHYGSQHLSEYHLRLFLRARNRLRVNAGIDRAGLLGFFSLFKKLGDQTHLVFSVDYQVAGPLWIFIHSRYTFEQAGTGPDGTRRYLVQRRFEPFAGLRVRL